MTPPIRRRLCLLAAAAALAATPLTSALAQSNPELAMLAAKQDITEQINRYPRALDRLDRELLMTVGHPDAKVSFGATVFPTWTAHVDWMMKAHEPMLSNNHRITNILIEVKGDKAVSEASGTATLLVKSEKLEDTYEERWMHSRYLDTWSKRNGKWALDSRQTLIDYRRVQLVPGATVRASYQIGQRQGRNDPSYKHFESLR